LLDPTQHATPRRVGSEASPPLGLEVLPAARTAGHGKDHDAQRQARSDHDERAVVVAMRTVRMVQVPRHQVVRVVTVWHRRVTARRAVGVVAFVGTACMRRRACHRVASIDLERTLVDVSVVGVVQVPFVEIVYMGAVPDCDVAAARAVGVIVIVVGAMVVMAHGSSSSSCCACVPSRACSSALPINSATCLSVSV